MELDEKRIEEIVTQLGITGKRSVAEDTIQRLSAKSDAELEKELLKLKEMLKSKNITYDKQAAILKSLSPMLDSNQKARLQKVMELLK